MTSKIGNVYRLDGRNVVIMCYCSIQSMYIALDDQGGYKNIDYMSDAWIDAHLVRVL